MDYSISFIAKETSPAKYTHRLHERTHNEKQKRDFTITEKQDEVSGQQRSLEGRTANPYYRGNAKNSSTLLKGSCHQTVIPN